MALNKVAPPTDDVIDILSPTDSREVSMGVKMEAMSHIVARLTDLYTDPISATVREVVSNATDASVQIPKALRQPIEITSPSTFKPSLTVRDRGVGMTTQIVEDIYSQYGGSTKEKDFSQIGAFGLGAKSPLSYCTEFSVSTTRDGVTTDFLVSRKTEGNVTKILSVRETDEESGTVVTIPVRMQDRARFDAALDSYRNYSFDVPVSIDGVVRNGNENYLNFDSIVLDEESGTTGRVWVHKDALPNLLQKAYGVRSRYGYSDSVNIRYSLSGWIYEPPQSTNEHGNRRYYGNSRYDVIVELKPGIVDFSSSRDQITDNDRSAALVGTVQKLIDSGSEYLVDNVLESYRRLDTTDSLNFISSIRDVISVEGDTVHFGDKATSTTTRKIEDFATEAGFNPLELVSKRHETNITAVIDLSDYTLYENGESKSFFSIVENWTRQSYDNKDNIAEKNRRILERVTEKIQDISFVDFFASMHFWSSSVVNSPTLIVTGVDDNNIVKLNRNRAVVARDLYPSYWALYTSLDSIPQDQVDVVNNIRNTPVEFISADDLIAKAVEYRRERSKLNSVNKDDANVHIRKLKDETLEMTAVDLVKGLDKHITSVSTTIQDIIDEDGIIVLHDNRSDLVAPLIGASNSGITITERPIYFASKYDLKASHFAILKDYEGTVASSKWSYNCKAATEISQNRVYSGIILKEEVAAMSAELAVGTYFSANYRQFTNPFLDALSEVTTDEAHLKTLKLIADSEKVQTASYRFRAVFDRDTLAMRLGQDQATRIYAFTDFVSGVISGRNLESNIAAVVVRSNSKIELTDIVKPILSSLIGKYEDSIEQVIANQKAAEDAEKAKLEAVESTEEESVTESELKTVAA